MDYSKQKINEVYKKLPDELKDAIVSVENADKLEDIGSKYHFDFEQKKALGNETGLVMLGLVRVADFADHLATRMSIEHEIALSVAGEVSRELFIPILPFLKKLNPEVPPVKAASIADTMNSENNGNTGKDWKKINENIPRTSEMPKTVPLPQPQKQEAKVAPKQNVAMRPTNFRLDQVNNDAFSTIGTSWKKMEPAPSPRPAPTPVPFKPAPTFAPKQNVTMRPTDYVVHADAFPTMGKTWKHIENIPEQKPAAPEIKPELIKNEPKISHAAAPREILSHAHILHAIENPDTIPANYEEMPHIPETSAKSTGPLISGVPEIAPEHELMIEPWEKVHDVPRTTQTKQASPVPPPKPSAPQVAPAQPNNSFTTVKPRFVTAQNTPVMPSPQSAPVPPPPKPAAPQAPAPVQKNSGGFIDQMLHSFISIRKEEKDADTAQIEENKEKNYKVDPYREQI